MDVKSKGVGWIPMVKFMGLWGKLTPFNSPEDVSLSNTEEKLYCDVNSTRM